MDHDPAVRVNKARQLFRKIHAIDGAKRMGVHEFGTYATAANFEVTPTDLVRARMALDPEGTQFVEPESFFTWLYSMLKSKKKSHLNKLLTRTLVGVQTISNRDLPGEAFSYGKPVVRTGETAGNTIVEKGNEWQPSKARRPDRDWIALNKNFEQKRLARRGNTTALDLKAVTAFDKSNMKYQNPYPTSRSRTAMVERQTGQFLHGGQPAKYGLGGTVLRREVLPKTGPKSFKKRTGPVADFKSTPAGVTTKRHLEPAISAIVEGREHVYDSTTKMYPENTGLKRYRENQKAKVHRLMHAPPTKASQGRILARGVKPEQLRAEELKQFKIKKFANVKGVINFKEGTGLLSTRYKRHQKPMSAPEMRLNTGRSQDPMRDRLKLTARLASQH